MAESLPLLLQRLRPCHRLISAILPLPAPFPWFMYASGPWHNQERGHFAQSIRRKHARFLAKPLCKQFIHSEQRLPEKPESTVFGRPGTSAMRVHFPPLPVGWFSHIIYSARLFACRSRVIMSKRKVAEVSAAVGDKAAGKRRAEIEPEAEPDDVLGVGGLLSEVGGDLMDNADDLADQLSAGEQQLDEDEEDDLLAAALGGDDDDDGPDEGHAEAAGPALPEPGDLPDGVTEESLTSDESITLPEMTLAQARRVAMALAKNENLTKVKLESGSELAVGDLKEDEELEWDSEEYTDVEAIIVAELLKNNETVHRLDLARNQISDAGVCALALMVQSNSTIEYLNLESNTFGERGGTAILQALESNTSLQYLNLMYNSVPTSTQGAIRQLWSGSRSVGLHL